MLLLLLGRGWKAASVFSGGERAPHLAVALTYQETHPRPPKLLSFPLALPNPTPTFPSALRARAEQEDAFPAPPWSCAVGDCCSVLDLIRGTSPMWRKWSLRPVMGREWQGAPYPPPAAPPLPPTMSSTCGPDQTVLKQNMRMGTGESRVAGGGRKRREAMPLSPGPCSLG